MLVARTVPDVVTGRPMTSFGCMVLGSTFRGADALCCADCAAAPGVAAPAVELLVGEAIARVPVERLDTCGVGGDALEENGVRGVPLRPRAEDAIGRESVRHSRALSYG